MRRYHTEETAEYVKKIGAIRATIENEKLTYVWLIRQLEKEGCTTCKETMSLVMSGYSLGKKARELIDRSYLICQRYLRAMELIRLSDHSFPTSSEKQ